MAENRYGRHEIICDFKNPISKSKEEVGADWPGCEREQVAMPCGKTTSLLCP